MCVNKLRETKKKKFEIAARKLGLYINVKKKDWWRVQEMLTGGKKPSVKLGDHVFSTVSQSKYFGSSGNQEQ